MDKHTQDSAWLDEFISVVNLKDDPKQSQVVYYFSRFLKKWLESIPTEKTSEEKQVIRTNSTTAEALSLLLDAGDVPCGFIKYVIIVCTLYCLHRLALASPSPLEKQTNVHWFLQWHPYHITSCLHSKYLASFYFISAANWQSEFVFFLSFLKLLPSLPLITFRFQISKFNGFKQKTVTPTNLLNHL